MGLRAGSRPRFWNRLALVFPALLLALPAYAQRAGEDALAAADDAFGTSVGNESIGLYGPYNARGFSPGQAGNMRIEGLYFDQHFGISNRVVAGNSVHVGISAQAYPFPAPTGIADFRLRTPGDEAQVSTVVSVGPFASYNVEIDAQTPVVPGRLSVGGGVGMFRIDNDQGSRNLIQTYGSLARFTPSDSAEIVGFWSREADCHNTQQPQIFTAGPYLPPRYELHRLYGQTWTRGSCVGTNFGAIGRTTIGGWILRGGVFRSVDTGIRGFGDLLLNVSPVGVGNHVIIAFPSQSFTGYSGELRASRVFAEGPRRHRIDLVARGRDFTRLYGGADVQDFGAGTVGVRSFVPERPYTFGPSTRDQSLQGTAGIAYEGLWRDVGQMGLGVQKTFYRRDSAQPGLRPTRTTAQPLLITATSSIFLTKSLAFYGSYTRGLEETGSAPSNATNRGEPMPVAITRQFDAGFRYIITPRLKFVAGVFQVQKPYFNLNAANVFGSLGTVRHSGIELSLAGQLRDDLTVVAGAVVLKPRLSGEPVDRGVVGKIPVGPRPGFVLLSLQYSPPAWTGFSVDGQITYSSSQIARSDGSLSVPSLTQFDLGARYSFTMRGVPASLRAQVINVTQAFAWGVNSSGSFYTSRPRSFKATLAADF